MTGPRLSITPAGAIFDRTLEPRDMHVLNLLGCYIDKAGWCRRSQVKMAKQLNCGRASIQRSLDRLCEAGWVQKKRPPWSNEEGPPSHSYMYRVVLDRDDAVPVAIDDDDEADEAGDSHAPDASQETECPPVGTGGAQHEEHPGARPCVGTGAQPYVGTKNDPLERPPIERERDARARDRTARFLVDFEKRWPTAPLDDRQRTAYAAEELTEEEQQGALASIAAFLEKAKRSNRKHVPAGWKYLEEKRWTLLEQPDKPSASTSYGRDSDEAKAIMTLHNLAGALDFFVKYVRKNDQVFYSRSAVTPQLLALKDFGTRDEWVSLTHQQAGAWNAFLEKYPTIDRKAHLRENSLAPREWPPKVDGSWPSTTGPPAENESLMSEQDWASEMK